MTVYLEFSDNEALLPTIVPLVGLLHPTLTLYTKSVQFFPSSVLLPAPFSFLSETDLIRANAGHFRKYSFLST